MATRSRAGSVALITGGAHGIGAAVAARLAADGAQVVVADVDDTAGAEVATRVGGRYFHTDVRDLEAHRALVADTVALYGGLDIVHLNAGVTTGCGLGDDFDEAAYRRAMAINLDGVVFGVLAARPVLQARGGGHIIATASLAGLVGVPMDPIYAANKHAVVGLVRSLGAELAGEGILLNALCPGFADTAIIDDIRDLLATMEVPVIDLAEVVEAVIAILDGGSSGGCWYVQHGRPSEPFQFRNVPGPR